LDTHASPGLEVHERRELRVGSGDCHRQAPHSDDGGAQSSIPHMASVGPGGTEDVPWTRVRGVVFRKHGPRPARRLSGNTERASSIIRRHASGDARQLVTPVRQIHPATVAIVLPSGALPSPLDAIHESAMRGGDAAVRHPVGCAARRAGHHGRGRRQHPRYDRALMRRRATAARHQTPATIRKGSDDNTSAKGPNEALGFASTCAVS